jgi:hypothetical protein
MRRALPVLLIVALAAVGWLAWRQGWFAPSGDASGTDADGDSAPAAVGAGGLAGHGAKIDPNKDPATFDGDPVGRVDAGLGKAILTGHVVSDAGPIRFARVVPVLPAPAFAAVRTTKDGAFEIRGLPAGDLDLRVSAETFWSRTVRTPALVEGAATDAGSILLKTRPAATDGLEVKVLDDSAHPVSGARVTMSTLDWSLLISIAAVAGMPDVVTRESTTDDLGVARFTAIPPNKYDAVVRAPEFVIGIVDNLVVAGGRVEHATVSIHRGLSLSGTIVDADNAPVPNAHVTALMTPQFRSCELVESDATGRFTLSGLDAGTYMVVAGRDDKGNGMAPSVKAGDRTTRIQLGGAGTVKGRVVSADGKPASHFLVRAYIESFFQYTYSRPTTVDDPDGRFTLSLAPGTYNLDVKPESGALTKATVTVTKDKTSEVVVKLTASGVVAGVVTDSEGNHLAGAEVFVLRKGFPDEPVREQYVRTDADGHFAMKNLALETLGLHVRCAGHTSTQVKATPAPEGTGTELTVKLPVGARVAGHVTSKDGQPVVGEQVNLAQGFNFFGAYSTTTAADGGYQFDHVEAGDWLVSTRRYENDSGGQQQKVTVGAEGTVVADFHTAGSAEAAGIINGTVRVGGQPVAKASVSAEDDRGPTSAVTATSDAEGKFTLRGLKPGRITVNLMTEGGLAGTERTRIDDVTKPASVEFEFGSASVRALLVASDGKTPVSGAWVMVEGLEKKEGAEVWESIKAQVNSDQQGVISVTGLDPATYRLRVNGSGYAALSTAAFTLGDKEAKDIGTIRLQPGGAVTGRVADDSGSPVEGIGVSVKNPRGEDVFLFNIGTTGSDGRFSLSGIELGEYTLKFEGKGFAPVSKPVTVGAGGAVVDVVLRRGGSVVVRVSDERGEPVAGARVVLYDATGKRVERTLSVASLFDADMTKIGVSGSTTIPDLAPGSYRVSATKEGMTIVGDPAAVTIEAGGAASVTLTLKVGG